MERHDWSIEKPRLLTALGTMEAWTATLSQSVQEAKVLVENADDDFLFRPASHPIGLPSFEVAMRDIDSSLREILAIHQALSQHYRENSVAFNTGNLFSQPGLTPDALTPDAIGELVQLLQNFKADSGNATPIVCHIEKDKIDIQIEEK